MKTAILLFVVACGIGLGARYVYESHRARQEKTYGLVRADGLRAISELSNGGVIGPVDPVQFVDEHISELRKLRDQAKKQFRDADQALATHLMSEYRSDETQLILEDYLEGPGIDRAIRFLALRYPDKIRTVAIDMADWPQFYQANQFGFGVPAEFKALIWRNLLTKEGQK